MDIYMPDDVYKAFNGHPEKQKIFAKWLGENIKIGETIRFTYMSNLENIFDKLLIDCGSDYYKFKANKKWLYFQLSVFDNSGASDCDVRYTYTCINKKSIKKLLNQIMEKL